MNNFEPKISIVINNYNYEKYVGVAIQSALDQTYKNIEIIVVDDGSVDNSKKIIESFIGVISIFKKNGGQSSAVNEGFLKSSGDLVIFLDSDDYLYSNTCEKIVSSYSADVSMYSYKLQLCNETGELSEALVPACDLIETGHLDFISKFGYLPTAPMSGAAYSRSFLLNYLPFDTKVWNTAFDSLLTFTAPIYGAIRSFNCALGAYRIGHASLSEHGKISMKKMRMNLVVSHLYSKEIAMALSVNKNKKIDSDFLLGPYHWKNRLISYAASNKFHPFGGDNRYKIYSYCVRSFVLWPQITRATKVKNIIQISILVCLPSRYILKLAKVFTNINIEDGIINAN